MTGHSTRTRECSDKAALARAKEPKMSTLRPFDRIPVEILTYIFSWAIEDDESGWPGPNQIDIRYHGAYYLPTFFNDGSRALDEIVQVCSHWRSVALKSSDLWRKVDVYQHIERLVIFLDRSQNKTLDVSLHRISGARLALPHCLVAHSHRLRKLALHWPDKDKADEEECRNFTYQVAQMDLPVLEELLVDHGEILWAQALPLDSNLLPSLRIVRFDTHHISWDSAIFTQLRILHLQDVYIDDEQEVPLSDFLEILAECQLLEELILARAACISFPYLTQGSTSEECLAGPIVELPKLRILHLEWDNVSSAPCENYQLLQHLRLRSETTVRIAIDFSPWHHVKSHLELVPRDPTRLPILATGTCARVSLYPSPPRLIRFVVGPTVENNDFTLLLADKKDFNMHVWNDADEHLTDFCALFADTPLTHLSLDAEGFSMVGLISSFCLLQHLTTIQVDFNTVRALDNLLSALATISPFPASSGPPPTPSPPPVQKGRLREQTMHAVWSFRNYAH
ncbi:hypothetical protein C8Q70DRAFT_410942 [Cubamyces menziesii]|nr:hypothetical protein C8Q70DRAFT_410942 [Cubamyces menziesii]